MTALELVPFLGLVLYCITYIGVLAIWAWSFGEDLTIEEDERGQRRLKDSLKFSEKSIPKLFYFFVLISLFARIVWIDLRAFESKSGVTFGLNRIAFCTFFTAFTLVVFHWAEKYHKNYVVSDKFMPKLGWIFIVFNVLLYLFQGIVTLLYYLTANSQREGNPLYESNMYIEIAVSVLVSLGFALYGMRLCLLRTRNTADSSIHRDDAKELAKMTLYTVVFVACFTCRAVFFFYRPVTGKYMPQELFYIFAYFIPDMLPTCLQVFIVQRTKYHEINDNRFIASLYAEAEADKLEPAPPLSSYVTAVSTLIEDYSSTANPKTPLIHK